MPSVVITGAPGAGKTTLIAELSMLGHVTVAESARAVIAERLALGLSPRPDPLAFAREILARDVAKYSQHPLCSHPVFFDRSAVEAAGMLHEASGLSSTQLELVLGSCRFHSQVFILPPWEAIYVQDAERDHPFDHALHVHAALVSWYRSCGYTLVEVPCRSAPERARFVRHALAEHGA